MPVVLLLLEVVLLEWVSILLVDSAPVQREVYTAAAVWQWVAEQVPVDNASGNEQVTAHERETDRLESILQLLQAVPVGGQVAVQEREVDALVARHGLVTGFKIYHGIKKARFQNH